MPSDDEARRSHVSGDQIPNHDALIALGKEIEAGETSPPGRSGQEVAGVEGNARLTSSVAAVIFVVLAVEGVTILRIGRLLDAHVFIGLLLIPLVLAKIASTTWRFAKYYRGDPAYRRKGPPALFLRLLGPLLIALTLIVLASGIALIEAPTSFRQNLMTIHKASFILWIAVMAVHVLGHLGETIRLAPRDWLLRTRRQVSGASSRQWLLVWSLALGLVIALALTPQVYGWYRG
ncbi:MAG TPA: hypothetical protein VGZ04_04880 [Acidimicrobiales bacterium]|jgi:hypothetical protein|nr:hypothetical protein [Acidimicrobiales bacterium]